jgi:death-on-curing protein
MITEVQAVRLHNILIDQFGGATGTGDHDGLLSALSRLFQTFDAQSLYPSAIEKAAAILESILTNHLFVDGNKRTVYVLMRLLRLQNCYDINESEDQKYAFVLPKALEKLRQTVPGFGRAGLHPRLEHTVPVLDRIDEPRRRHRRLAIALFERDCLHHDVTGHAFELKGVDEPLGRRDLAVLAAEAILIALRVALDEAPRAARSDIHYVDNRRGAALTPPVGDVLRIGVGLEYELARRIEDPRHPDFAI